MRLFPGLPLRAGGHDISDAGGEGKQSRLTQTSGQVNQ